MNDAPSFDRFTESAIRVLFFARAAVSEYGGTVLRDAHLLIGLMKVVPDSVALFVPDGGAVQRLAECLSAQIAAPDLVAESVEVPFDERVKRILLQAVRAADKRGHSDVTPEHLLLAFLSDDTVEAAECLRQVGADRDAIDRWLLGKDRIGGLDV
jgi:ATP-dependent Clp protease ATP-binding subunit ClpC